MPRERHKSRPVGKNPNAMGSLAQQKAAVAEAGKRALARQDQTTRDEFMQDAGSFQTKVALARALGASAAASAMSVPVALANIATTGDIGLGATAGFAGGMAGMSATGSELAYEVANSAVVDYMRDVAKERERKRRVGASYGDDVIMTAEAERARRRAEISAGQEPQVAKEPAADHAAGDGDPRETQAATEGGDTGTETAVSDTAVAEPQEGVPQEGVPQEGGPRIIINPTTFKNQKDALCVAWNEGIRVFMEASGFEPESEPTEKQRRFFSDTPYADDETQMRRTILARIATFDTSVTDPTDDQLAETAKVLRGMLESDFVKTDDEARKCEKLASAVEAAIGAEVVEPREEPAGPQPEEPEQPVVEDTGGLQDTHALTAGGVTKALLGKTGTALGFAYFGVKKAVGSGVDLYETARDTGSGFGDIWDATKQALTSKEGWSEMGSNLADIGSDLVGDMTGGLLGTSDDEDSEDSGDSPAAKPENGGTDLANGMFEGKSIEQWNAEHADEGLSVNEDVGKPVEELAGAAPQEPGKKEADWNDWSKYREQHERRQGHAQEGVTEDGFKKGVDVDYDVEPVTPRRASAEPQAQTQDDGDSGDGFWNADPFGNGFSIAGNGSGATVEMRRT